jgi:CheY-like chemotaxis protein
MKKVLIVDDDAVTRGLLSRVLKPHIETFEVVTAKDGQEALSIIIGDRVDLVITDIQMPNMDGFQLLASLVESHPEVPVFVMTAFGDTEVKKKAEALGFIKYFEKPLNIDIITDCILEELDAGMEGELRGVSLPSFLQLVEMEDKTCTVEVVSGDHGGKMYFRKGVLMDAEFGEMNNLDAVYELLCLDKVAINIDNICKKKEKEIAPPLMTVLMEGLRLRDERENATQKKTPLKPLQRLQKK